MDGVEDSVSLRWNRLHRYREEWGDRTNMPTATQKSEALVERAYRDFDVGRPSLLMVCPLCCLDAENEAGTLVLEQRNPVCVKLRAVSVRCYASWSHSLRATSWKQDLFFADIAFI